jgi:hypothetical protein
LDFYSICGHELLLLPWMREWGIRKGCDDCSASARDNRKQGPIAILQGFGYEPGTTNPQFGCRDPTYSEVRYMLYTSLARDGMGAVFWVDYRSGADLRATVDTVIHEASSLGAAIAGGQFRSPLIEVSEPLVGYKYCADGAGRYIIAVNESSRDSLFEVVEPRTLQDVDFALPPGLEAASVRVLYDRRDEATGQYAERSLPLVRDGSGRLHFVDSFAIYEVHVYQIL